MRKLDKLQILKNVGSSWFSLGINVLTGLFLSPFILHRLGDSAYGIWVLIFSVTGYYGLFDLGIRTSIVRYVSKFVATEETENLAKLINTSLFSYACIGVVTMLVTLAVCTFMDRLFRIPAEFHTTARLLFLMVGASVALGFPLGVFGGVLEGLQRFYIMNWTSAAASLLRTALIIIVMNHGYGLLTVALITVALPLVSSIIRGVVALRILRIGFGFHYLDGTTFRLIANYSGITFIVLVAGRLRFRTDEIVIGGLLTASAITYFSIGARIVDYASEVVSSLAQIFVPMSSDSHAKGDIARLRKIMIAGNRACAFIILPIAAILIILGKSVIEAWVGSKYIAQSYSVLVILIIPFTLMLAQSASGRILFGTSQHKTFAIVALVEGVANLILSLLLVRPYGIVGDALGTAIPLSCTMLVFMPRHVCRTLGIEIPTFLREAYTLPLVACMPMVIVLLLMQHWFVPHGYRQLAMQLLTAGTVYGAGLLWMYRTNRAFRVGDLSPANRIESQTCRLNSEG
jgi:O-antigen/teichoic acid export membrane protein